MFVRSVDELRARGEEVVELDGRLRCFNLLTKADGLGFSLHDVRSAAGSAELLWYKHHWESNYIIAGTGSVEEVSTGRVWPLEPGVIYGAGPAPTHERLEILLLPTATAGDPTPLGSVSIEVHP